MRGCRTRATEEEFAYFEALEISFPIEDITVGNLKTARAIKRILQMELVLEAVLRQAKMGG